MIGQLEVFQPNCSWDCRKRLSKVSKSKMIVQDDWTTSAKSKMMIGSWGCVQSVKIPLPLECGDVFFFAALVNQCSCREHPFNWICIRSILNIMCLFLPQSSKYLQRRFFRYVLGVCIHPHKVFGSLGLILHICNNEKSIVAQILPIFKLEMHLWSTFSQKIIRPLYTLLVYIYIYIQYLIVYI